MKGQAMIKAMMAALLLATGTAAAQPATVQAGGITLRPVGADLPFNDTSLPDGPGADLMAANCQSCHSPGMIMTQPRLTQAEWTGEVNKMLNVYKAPIAKEDVPAIVAYLTAMPVAP